MSFLVLLDLRGAGFGKADVAFATRRAVPILWNNEQVSYAVRVK